MKRTTLYMLLFILSGILAGMSSLLYSLYGSIAGVSILAIGTCILGILVLYRKNQIAQLTQNSFYRDAFELSTNGIALISLENNILRANAALATMLSYSTPELQKLKLKDLFFVEDLSKFKLALQQLHENQKITLQENLRLRNKLNEQVWISLSLALIRNAENQPQSYLAQFHDITQEKFSADQLRRLAYHDALTGLINRNRLEQELKDIIAYARRANSGFALLFFDLDHFKNVNDTLGHDSGDILLQIVSERLRNAVRTTDIISRLGGDEFVIVLRNLNNVDVIAAIVQKAINSLANPMIIKGNEVFVTTSIGISVYPYDGVDLSTLMRNADLALYRAKELGRNSYQFCTPEMTAKAQEKMAKQNALMQALAKNEFLLYYQPKFDVAKGEVSGVEALLRWKNKEYDAVNPGEIIRLAEETGLIVPLNEWVLKTACVQMKKWHAMGFRNLIVSVNMSQRQFKQANLAESIMQILNEQQYPPHLLELEITESLIMQDPEYVLSILQGLKQKGIHIALDDYGTGYSSLDYLRRFAIDGIKIDQTFIQRLTLDESIDTVVKAMIAMANKLNIKTIAEGVETKQQFEFLRQEKCGEIQGYYVSHPMGPDEMTKFLLASGDAIGIK